MSNTIVIGAGVSGVFTVLTLLDNGVEGKDITLIDKGNYIEKRHCFVSDTQSCKKCKTCSVILGFGGGGSGYNDGKQILISKDFPNSPKVGGNLIKFASIDELENLSNEVVDIYNKFGMKNMNVKPMGMELSNGAKKVLDIIENNPNLDIHQCITQHIGSERSREIYRNMQDYIINQGVNVMMNTSLEDLLVKDNKCVGIVTNKGEFSADNVVLGLGRYGNVLIGNLIEKYKIEKDKASIDIGVRVEVPSHIMDPLEDFYEAKIVSKGRYGDEARMFCYNRLRAQCVNEKYDVDGDQLITVNGHAYSSDDMLTNTDNFAILVKRDFGEDIEKPIDNYVLSTVKMVNSIANGNTIMQTLEDLKLFKRSTEESIKRSNVRPTLKSYPGDLANAIPYRIMCTILDMIEELDTICTGINDGKNMILHGMEVKLHSNGVKVKDGSGKTNIDGLYVIGDCSSHTRGNIQAASMGILCAKDIINN